MKKTNLFLGLLLLATVSFVFTSCDSGSGAYPGFDQNETGMYYKFHSQNEGDKAVEGDFMTLAMVYRTADSTLFDSQMNPAPMQIPLSPPDYQGDIYDSLVIVITTYKCWCCAHNLPYVLFGL